MKNYICNLIRCRDVIVISGNYIHSVMFAVRNLNLDAGRDKLQVFQWKFFYHLVYVTTFEN